MHFHTVARLTESAFRLAVSFYPIHRGLIYLEFPSTAKSVFGVIKELRYFVTGTEYLFRVTIMYDVPCGTRCFTVKALLATSFATQRS